MNKYCEACNLNYEAGNYERCPHCHPLTAIKSPGISPEVYLAGKLITSPHTPRTPGFTTHQWVAYIAKLAKYIAAELEHKGTDDA